MKKTTIITLLLLLCGISRAQDSEFKVLENVSGHKYESYMTNDWQDNLFIGVAGGISTKFTAGKYSDIIKPKIDPMVDIYVIKWFTPIIGVRIGYLGLTGSEGLNSYMPYQINHSPFPYKLDSTGEYVSSSSEPGTLSYGSFHIHGDLMWNLSHTFGGYNRSRPFNVSLYASCGYLKLYDNRTEGNRGLFSKCNDREFTLGAGAYGTYRITGRLLATADLRYVNHASRYRTTEGVRTNVPSLTIGLAYNLYRTTWAGVDEVNATLKEAQEAALAAEEKIAIIQKEYDKAQAEIKKLEEDYKDVTVKDSSIIQITKVEYADLKKQAEGAGLVIYFHINKSDLHFSEVSHLTAYVKNCLAKDKEHVFHVTGSADKGTGNEALNAKLSYARALFVKKCLMTDLGVKEENIIIDNVITDRHLDGAYDRCAIID